MSVSDPLIQLRDSRNLNFYKSSGAIASVVLDKLIQMCKVGTVIRDMCDAGDKMILEEVDRVYTKLKYKGIAFPTNVSVNHIAANCTESTYKLCDGDLVKIDLGVHINGFPAIVGFTVFINESNMKIDDARSRVVIAVAEASKEILKILKPDNKNTQVVDILDKVAKKYNCNVPINSQDPDDHVPGFASYQMSQHVIDGFTDDEVNTHSIIINKHNLDYEYVLEEIEFIEDEVYCIDVMMSSGSGSLTKCEDQSNSIFKRDLDAKVLLKLKGSREVLSSFPKSRFPISLKDRSAKLRFGLKECIIKGLLEEYPPMQDKVGTYVARARFTVIVRKKPLLIVARSADDQIGKFC